MMLCREYAECKAKQLQRARQEAEEAESQLLKLSEDVQHKVIHLCNCCWHSCEPLRPKLCHERSLGDFHRAVAWH